MFKKDKQWVGEIVSEHQEHTRKYYECYANGVAADRECKHVKLWHTEKPTLRPAWQAHIISEHGIDSRDWKDYQEEMAFITDGINSCLNSKFRDTHLDYYRTLNKNTRDELISMGYTIEQINDATRISW